MVHVRNIPLETCKMMALEYQVTAESKIFLELLYVFDKLLLRVVHQFKRRVKVLNDEDVQDMYHTGVLGLAKALNSVLETESSEKLPQRVAAYVKAELVSMYRYELSGREVSLEVLGWAAVDKRVRCLSKEFLSYLAECDLRTVLELDMLSDEERQCVRLLFIDKISMVEISQVLSLSYNQVRYRVRQGMYKLLAFFKKRK